MKNSLLLLLLFFSSEATSQKVFPLDTTMKKAMSPDGYRDTKIDFKSFSVKATDGQLAFHRTV